MASPAGSRSQQDGALLSRGAWPPALATSFGHRCDRRMFVTTRRRQGWAAGRDGAGAFPWVLRRAQHLSALPWGWVGTAGHTGGFSWQDGWSPWAHPAWRQWGQPQQGAPWGGGREGADLTLGSCCQQGGRWRGTAKGLSPGPGGGCHRALPPNWWGSGAVFGEGPTLTVLVRLQPPPSSGPDPAAPGAAPRAESIPVLAAGREVPPPRAPHS